MSKYKVLVEFELEGVKHEVGSEVELADDVATPLIESKHLELVAA